MLGKWALEYQLSNTDDEDRRATMASIRQDVYPDFLPDFRNLGVIARMLVGINLIALAAAALGAESPARAVERFMQMAALIEPLLLASVALLSVVSALLSRLSYWIGWGAVIALVLALAAGEHAAFLWLGLEPPALWRTLLLSTLATVCLLYYLRLLVKAYSPALAEARLQALQARIRPHFLFNSLNAVLSLIRRDPKRAERALEDLADMFRTLMSDGRRFVRLADEIALLERYAGLEQLRLGERLRIVWELDAAPSDALLPPMVLQPLLENAIYHGVEPSTGVADVLVRIERRGERVRALIENPFAEAQQHRSGNKMALANIRERLALFFDAEARIETRSRGARYSVEIEMPYRTDARAETRPEAA
jgi:two-component system sensor histidine kinase AlgZ